MQFIRKYWVAVICVIIFFALLFNLLNEHRKERLLQKSNSVIGLLQKEDHSSLKFNDGIFIFFVKNKKYIIRHKGDFSHLKKGVTVLIEYAIEDPSVARVVDKYYMQKYKHLKEK